MTAKRRIACICEQCGVTFEVTPWYRKMISGRFCSHTCQAQSTRRSVEERLYEKIAFCPHAPTCLLCCWPWTGATNRDGYGIIAIPTTTNSQGLKLAFAHRLSWEVANSITLPKGTGQYVVRHICGNRACCNHAHLIFGTQAANVHDSIRDGTMPRGERNGLAKLTPSIVQEIRWLYAHGATKAAIARQFSVTFMTIHAVLIGKTWKHVP